MTSPTTTRIELSEHSWLEHTPQWLTNPDRAFSALLTELAWTQEPIPMYGGTVLQPRLTAVCGASMDPASRYRRPRPDQPWTTTTATIRDTIAATDPGWTPNGLIVNYYRGNSDSISWHSDDEPALGTNPLVISVSLGATRRIKFRPATGGPTTTHIDVADGDLLTMGGACQTEYQHSIAKTRRTTGPRISLTYRQYHPNR